MSPETKAAMNNVYDILVGLAAEESKRLADRYKAAAADANSASMFSRRAFEARAQDAAEDADAADRRQRLLAATRRQFLVGTQREAREKARPPAVAPKNGNGNGRHPREMYPWDEWFDGRPHTLVRGRDFPEHLTAPAFANQAYVKGRYRGLKVTTSTSGDSVMVRNVGKRPGGPVKRGKRNRTKKAAA